MAVLNNFEFVIASDNYSINLPQNDSSSRVLEENLKILGELAYAEHNKDFNNVSKLRENLHPDFNQRLANYISSVGFLSKEIILQVQTEVCVEALLDAIYKADDKRASELLDQLIWIHPRNSELYKYLWEICGQPDLGKWGEDAFHGRQGYFAAGSDKEKAILKFKTFLQVSWNEDLLAYNPTPVSLEKEFENQGCFTIDIADCGFGSYLSPNEGNPQNIAPHLLAAQKLRGCSVVTGTERILFHLLFSNENTCQGVIGRDINWKAKAYMDFNTALLRVSKTVQEYAELSRYSTNPNDLNERTETVKVKIEASNLDARIKKYYLENVYQFGEIYFRTNKNWRNRMSAFYAQCRYDQDEKLFLKLKRYADSGNIVCIVGDINNLTFLKNRSVTAVDTSNIHDYICLNLKGEGVFQPRIIWTCQDSCNTGYLSCIFKPMSDKEIIELDELIDMVVKSSAYKIERIGGFLHNLLAMNETKSGNFFHDSDPLNAKTGALYSVETLNELRNYVSRNFFKVPRIGFVNMTEDDIKKLNGLSTEEIHQLCQNPDIKPFLEILVDSWTRLDSHVYLAFSKIEGWEEQFESTFSSRFKNLPGLLDCFEKQHLLEQFILEFGQERLDNLRQKINKTNTNPNK